VKAIIEIPQMMLATCRNQIDCILKEKRKCVFIYLAKVLLGNSTLLIFLNGNKSKKAATDDPSYSHIYMK
jgi:hypothetical protein